MSSLSSLFVSCRFGGMDVIRLREDGTKVLIPGARMYVSVPPYGVTVTVKVNGVSACPVEVDDEDSVFVYSPFGAPGIYDVRVEAVNVVDLAVRVKHFTVEVEGETCGQAARLRPRLPVDAMSGAILA